MRFRRPSIALLLGLALTMVHCSDGGGSGSSVRSEMLESVGGRIILPGLERFAASSEALADAMIAREERPDAASLEGAREAWRDARAAWNRLEAGLFDPPFSVSLVAQIDSGAVDVDRIEADIAGDGPLDRAAIERLGSTRKGFATLEYLLFDADGSDPRRLAYGRATAEEMERVATRMVVIWSPAGENELEDFTSEAADPLQRIANRLVTVAETAADVRLGAVLGRTSGGLAQPEVAESARSGNSLADLRNDLLGIADLYEGRFEEGSVTGVSALVAQSSPSVRSAISDAIDDALRDVEAIPEPLSRAARDDRASVERAFESTKILKEILAVDLVSALGTSLTFSPFDGD